MRKSKYQFVVKRHCPNCCNENKERLFRLGFAIGIRAYICTKCGFWQDADSFLKNE